MAVRKNSLTAHVVCFPAVQEVTGEMLESDVKVARLLCAVDGHCMYLCLNLLYSEQFQWGLYVWRCSSGGRVQSV